MLAVLLLLLAACGTDAADDAGGDTDGPDASTGEPYRIAMIADASGPLATIAGIPIAAGVRGAVHAINEAGGVNGHPVELRVFDGRSDVSAGVSAARRAVDEEPHALIVASLQHITSAMFPVLEEVEIPSIVITPFSHMLFPDPVPWYFTGTNTPLIGHFLADCARQVSDGSLDGVRIAFAGIDAANPDAFFAAATVRAEAEGAEVVADERRAFDVHSFTVQGQRLAQADPDVIIVQDGDEGTGAMVVNDIITAGYDGPFCVGEGVSTPAFFEAVKSPDVWAVRALQHPDELPEVQESLIEAGEDPSGTLVTFGWVAAHLVAEAFASCELPCESDTMTTALEAISGYSPPGGDVAFAPISFSSSKHWFTNAVRFYAWSDEEGGAVPVGDLIDVSDVEPILEIESPGQ